MNAQTGFETTEQTTTDTGFDFNAQTNFEQLNQLQLTLEFENFSTTEINSTNISKETKINTTIKTSTSSYSSSNYPFQ